MCSRNPLIALFSISLLCVAVQASGDTGVQPAPVRGSLVQSRPALLLSISAADFAAVLQTTDAGRRLLQVAGTPKCGIDVFKLQYHTVGGAGEPTTASGALMVPTGDDVACHGERPIVLYAHGTQLNQNFDIGEIEDIDNNDEGTAIAAVFAARGDLVVAPNYAGYDTSSLGYHPFVNTEQQSKDTMDSLAAARWAMTLGVAPHVRDSGELFITGFSQGGLVAMATHRALQGLGIPVTASAPLSGPYAIAAYADAQFAGRVDYFAPLELTLVIDSYQHAYGNIYSAPTDIVQTRYADSLNLLPTNDPNVFSQGELPILEAFASVPPAPQFASVTPATTPADLAPLFALGFGPNHLITNAYRLQYLLDSLANPDGGWPTITTGLPAAGPVNTLRQAFKRNDMRNWSPRAPVMMCGGTGDVNFMNALLMQNYWDSIATKAPISVVNLDSPPALMGDPYASLKNGFAATKASIAANAVAGGATDGGTLAVLTSYHVVIEELYCIPAARVFFERHRRVIQGGS